MFADLTVGQMLPDIVVAAADGTPVALRPARGETTVILAAAPEDYVRELASVEEEFRVWEARLILVHAEEPRTIVADRYGQIFYALNWFPPARQLTEWLKHLGTLCPE